MRNYKKITHIAVALDVRHYTARRIIAGVYKYAATRPDWEIVLLGNHPSNDGFIISDSARITGAIVDATWLLPQNRGLIDPGRLRGAVFATIPVPEGFKGKAQAIGTDDRSLAETAARLFLRHGLRHFGYVGSHGGEDWSRARGRFFRDALAAAGYPLDTYSQTDASKSDWNPERASLGRWLKNLPKPCGVLAAIDQRALHILDLCRNMGIAVPEQIQVLGIDDEDYICEQTRPSLSSIAPDYEGGGVRAAEALDRILTGRLRGGGRLTIPVRGVVERLSTSDLRQTGNRVTRARDFIRLNATNGITVAEVARATGGSVRLLEYDFQKILGQTIRETIIAEKLAAVKRLLAETSTPLGDIAAACGFRSPQTLKNIFRRRVGICMRAYRQNAKSPSGEK